MADGVLLGLGPGEPAVLADCPPAWSSRNIR